ncbi:MAG: hypothetical protein ABI832_20000 [bacterium]
MAYAKIYFEHPQSGRIKEAPVGFSWTSLFFGFFPALLRGDWLMAVVMFMLGPITFGISGFVFAFIYNKIYIKHLIGEGFKATSASQDLHFLTQKIGRKIPQLPT